jgi:anti-anti-sigma factor
MSELIMSLALTITPVLAKALGAAVLKISGPMVLGNLFDFQKAVRAESAPLIVLDLTDVPYMDSAALGSVVNAHVSCVNRNRRLALVGISERVATLLKVTQVDKVLAIYPTLSEALQAAGGTASSA